MLKQTSQGSVQGFVAGKESREWQDTLAAEFLNETTLGEDHAENVAVSRQGDEHRERTLCGTTHDVAEEGGSDQTATLKNLLLGNSGEVGNVDEHVKNRDGDDTGGRSDLEGANGVLGLAEGVVGVAVSNVTPDDVVQSCDNSISAAGGALEGIAEVVRLLVLGELDMATKGNETTQNDDQDDDQLDRTKEVLQAQTPLERKTVDQEGGGDACQTNAALVPPVDLNVGRVEDVLAEDDGVTTSPTEQDDISSVQTSGQELGTAIDVFEVVLLTTVLWDSSSPFEVDGGSSESDNHTSDPDKERQADTARKAEDGTGSSEDTGTNDTVDDQEDGGGDSDLSLGFTRMLDSACSSRVSKVLMRQRRSR